MREGLLELPGSSDRADTVIPSVDNCKRDVCDLGGITEELSRAEPGVVDEVMGFESADRRRFIGTSLVRAGL